MSDFNTPEEEAVVDYIEEALEGVNDWFEHEDFSVGRDESGKPFVEEYGNDGYDNPEVINTYSIEIKVKKND